MEEIKVGDTVMSRDTEGIWTFPGDVGVVVKVSTIRDNTVYVDFNNQGNPKVMGEGVWAVNTTQLKTITK